MTTGQKKCNSGTLRETESGREAQSSKLKAQGKQQATSAKPMRRGLNSSDSLYRGIRPLPRPICKTRRVDSNHCERSCRDRDNQQRVRLRRPVRHERGEGRGEGCFTMASGPTLRSASSPQPFPPFQTEERETEAPARTARTFPQVDTDDDPNAAPQASAPQQPVRAARRRPNSQARTPAVPRPVSSSAPAHIEPWPLLLPLSFELYPWSFSPVYRG